MVFSTFSHYSLVHFGLNMYVLKSFMDGKYRMLTFIVKWLNSLISFIAFLLVTTTSMGKEQFLAFYMSAGVFSSLSSHVVKSLMRSPGLSLGAVSMQFR